jgi:hypothetical protein
MEPARRHHHQQRQLLLTVHAHERPPQRTGPHTTPRRTGAPEPVLGPPATSDRFDGHNNRCPATSQRMSFVSGGIAGTVPSSATTATFGRTPRSRATSSSRIRDASFGNPSRLVIFERCQFAFLTSESSARSITSAGSQHTANAASTACFWTVISIRSGAGFGTATAAPCAPRAWMSARCRSSDVRPPRIPDGSNNFPSGVTVFAYTSHCTITGQFRHTSIAAAFRASRSS